MDNKLASFLFESTGVERARKFLDIASARQKLIASNVANVTTPGYRSQDIDFKGELARLSGNGSALAGQTTHANHIPLGQHQDRAPEIHHTRVGYDDLNSVDIDREVPKMAQNELLFTVGARMLQKKFDVLSKVITSK